MGPRPPPGRSSTNKSGARWSLPLTFFLLFTAAQQSEPLIATPNLELAMMGYDPLMADVMEQPDQGRKWRLFTAKQREPLYVEKKDCVQTRDDVLNYFVDEVQQSRCSPSWTEAVVHTYEEYKSLTSASISFATEEDATTPLGASTEFNFKDKAGYGSQNNPNAVFIRNFFNESQREAILVKAVCVTHTVSILPFHEPVFTPAFESALYALYEAAIDTNLKTRRNVLRQFVTSYGTHFARTTHFGYAAYFVKLISARARTPAEEAVRRQRVLESARETLTPGGRRGCETTAEHFSRVVAGKFGEEGVDELVTETGSASVSGADDYDLAAKESPRPVAYILEKISSLFKETRGASQWLETRQLNVTALPAFLEEKLGEYSQEVVEREETLSKHLCSWRRSITTTTTAGPPSTASQLIEEAAARKAAEAVCLGSSSAITDTSTDAITDTLEPAAPAVEPTTMEPAAVEPTTPEPATPEPTTTTTPTTTPTTTTTTTTTTPKPIVYTCPSGHHKYKDASCYMVSVHTDIWTNAYSYCTDRGYSLARIESLDEQHFVAALINEDTWIDLNDRVSEGEFLFTNGHSTAFTYWASGEPNDPDKRDEEDCTEMRKVVGFLWNDKNCDNKRRFVCEKPTTVL